MPWRLGACALAAGLLTSPAVTRAALASAAAVLFEATPFLLAGALTTRLLRRPGAVAYLGCGCGNGPSARSLPAAAAAWLVFGPAVAAARLAAAVAAGCILQRRVPAGEPCSGTHARCLLDELAALLPAALAAGAAAQLTAQFDPRAFPAALQLVTGAALGFAAAPCGLGAVAVAAALHARAPLAAGGFLCVAGIADLRALTGRRPAGGTPGDMLGYALLACALGVVAAHRGGGLVHPAIAVALAGCAAIAVALAVRFRRRQNARLAIAPALMLSAALIAAPPPQYRASETTLADLFPGEWVSFTGVLVRDGHRAALVRYAITCCRADAAPVAVRLARDPAFAAGTWLRAAGPIVAQDGATALSARDLAAIAPPADPFVYR